MPVMVHIPAEFVHEHDTYLPNEIPNQLLWFVSLFSINFVLQCKNLLIPYVFHCWIAGLLDLHDLFHLRNRRLVWLTDISTLNTERGSTHLRNLKR